MIVDERTRRRRMYLLIGLVCGIAVAVFYGDVICVLQDKVTDYFL